METYEYIPPEKKEEPRNLDKLEKLFGKEETAPPQPKIPPQPNIPPQPTSSSQTPQPTSSSQTPKPAIELSPEQTREYKEEEKRKEALQKRDVIDREFRSIEQKQPTGRGLNMVSVILAVVIAAVTLMIGLVVFANVSSSLPTPEAAPAVQEAATQVVESSGAVFNFVALGLFILAAVFIIGIMANVLGGSK